jgi:ABC-type sugar transport system substrate-binding protein
VSEPKDNESKGTSRRDFLVASGGVIAGASVPALLAPGVASAMVEALPKPKRPQHYVWVTANLSDPFYNDGINGMKAFGKIFGAKVQIVGPQQADVAAMAKTFQTVLAEPGVTGIFSYFYTDFNTAKPMYEQAQRQGIPIVNGAGDWGPPRINFTGQKADDPPHIAAAYIAKYLKGKGNVGFIGNTGANIVRFEQLFSADIKAAGLNYVGHATHNGSASDAIKQFQAFLTANPNVDVMWFADGLSASIADALAAAAGKTKVVLGGFGKNGLAAIAKGKILAAVDRSPYDEEFYGFQNLYWWNLGYRVPDTTLIDTFVVDGSNVKKFLANPYRR